MRRLVSQDEMTSWQSLERADALHVSVALVLLGARNGQLQVLMQDNHHGPFLNHPVLPSTILQGHQTLAQAAGALCEDTELIEAHSEQFHTFSCPDLDPRGRVLTTGFVGAVPRERLDWVAAGNDRYMVDIEIEAGCAVLSIGGLPIRAGFSHDEVVAQAVGNLRKAIDYSLLPFSFVPEVFTISELQSVHEAILGRELTAPWFRTKMLGRVFEGNRQIVGTGIKRRDGDCRPAELFELRYVDPEERKALQRIAKGARRDRKSRRLAAAE